EVPEDLLDELYRDLGYDEVQFPLFTAAELNSGQFETRYLIPGVLVAGQPGGIFGAFKTLKTSLTADLLISLASGTPFLGQFPVAEPCRTLFLSGESGLAALQSIARRISTSRGLSLKTLDNFLLSPKLPQLDNDVDRRALKRLIRDKRPACVAIDPAYLAIRGEDSRNLFAMGSVLRLVAELGDETGCTILVVHHCKRSKQIAGDPATLDDIAWSGFAEFSAQWLMLSRRRRFDSETGHDELWLTAGGRAGHHGQWALDVEEGTPEGPGGRVWQTALSAPTTAETEAEVRQLWAVQGKRERQCAVTLRRNRNRVLAALEARESGETPRYLRQNLGLTCIGVNAVLGSLLDEGLIEPTQIAKRDRVENGYRVVAGQALAGG
ncbi:MAG TPA: AAA family ATPase, partial [Planctomycetaceae bacterium]|nr:AAA family ATPase [Planctomycetaceae bacterium]